MISLIVTIIVLTILGCILAVALYLVARMYGIKENPLVNKVLEILPGSNCGGCGSAGCRGFADKCVHAETLDGSFCVVGGNEVMSKVAAILGKEVVEQQPKIAVLLCAGCKDVRPKTNVYDGATLCEVVSHLYGGETGCQYGCAGYGDCIKVCKAGAISKNEATGLIEIDEDKCKGCGACVKACPKSLIQLRYKGPKRVYVSCKNRDRGAVSAKACKASCIGCGKCLRTCEHNAITLEDNLAYIDFEKCVQCGKCAEGCPTGAIKMVDLKDNLHIE